MENHVPNGKKVMEEELIRGRDVANQLLEVLAHKSNTHLGEEEASKSILAFAEDLVCKVLRSFTNTLLLLNSDNDVSDEVAASISLKNHSFSTNCLKMETMDETCKSRNGLNTKRRRGCYKRKSIVPTWERDSSIGIEDGHGWRKYGQKRTLNAKHLKSYYRCTHKYDQGCEAIKHEQKIEDDPPLYRTTYYGHHTCNNSLNPEIILEPVSPSSSSILLSFNNNSLQSKQEKPFSSSLLAPTKHEPMQVIHDDHITKTRLSSSEDDLLFHDYEINFDYWRHVYMLSSTESVEVNDVYDQFGLW